MEVCYRNPSSFDGVETSDATVVCKYFTLIQEVIHSFCNDGMCHIPCPDIG